MDMVRHEINEAFLLISSIPVSGDSVEVMHVAKEHLRAAYKLADNRKEPEGAVSDG